MKLTTMVFVALFNWIAWASPDRQTVPVIVTDQGFEPNEIKVKPDTHLILKVTRKTDVTCATQIQVKEKKIKKDLLLNKEVVVDLGVLKKGEVKFACGMNMVTGHIVVD